MHFDTIHSQFDPERFVDSLLGIGAAGGKSGGTMGIPGLSGAGKVSTGDQEGVMLARRLAAMRQERNARNVQATTAAAKSKQSAAAAAAAAGTLANPAATSTTSSSSSSSSSVRELTSSGAATGASPSFKPGNPRRKGGQSTKKKKGKK
jgi:hypothetical protein